MNRDIFGVYYIYCKNNWKDVVTEQVQSIFDSNILLYTKKLYVVVSYTQQQEFDFIKKLLNHKQVQIYGICNNTQYEFPALKLVKDICKKNICNIFYMHTKGTGISTENMNFYHGSTNIEYLRECVHDWRRFMEYFILYKVKKNTKLLEKYDACGVNLVDHPNKHFSGNFWWSKSLYINKLQDLDKIDITHRWNAEFWIGSGNGKLYSHHQESNAGYTKKITTSYK